MGGEEIPRAGDRQRHLEWTLVVLHEAAGPLEHGEGRVTLVQMTDLRLQTERAQQAPADDSEDELLARRRSGPPP